MNVKILNNKGFYPSLTMIYLTQTLLLLLAAFNNYDGALITLTFCVIGAFLWILFRGRQPYIANVATTVLGMIYCGWLPLHLSFLRHLNCERFNDGLVFLVMILISVILTDTGCYYVGRNFGKHKLAPVISPNKTIEGSIGGIICAIIGSMVIGWYIGLEWYLSFAIGLICTVFAQIGDLCESLIKRDAGVKDSGDILPGHGGFLDRCDSYILTIPVMYYFCKYFIFSQDIVNNIAQIF
jgi:phosphatidate cytidylyltransferase